MQTTPGSLQGRLAELGARQVAPARCDVFSSRELLLTERRLTRSALSGVRVDTCDLRRGELIWSAVTGPGSLTLHVALACSQGWFIVRRSGKVADPGLWQHAVTKEVSAHDLRESPDGRFDWVGLSRRALDEQIGLVVEEPRLRPWLLQRFVGPATRYDVYAVVDCREFAFDRLVRSRRKAAMAGSADGAAVIEAFSDWSGREVHAGLLAPAGSTKSLLASLVRP